MRVCVRIKARTHMHTNAHTWKRWLRALLIAHRWLFTIEKAESDRKWCSPCVVAESVSPGRASGRDILPAGSSDATRYPNQKMHRPRPEPDCRQASLCWSPSPPSGQCWTPGPILPGSRRAASPSSGKLLLAAARCCDYPAASARDAPGTQSNFFNGLRCVRIPLNSNAKPQRRVRNSHLRPVVSYKCIRCFYWRVIWELFFCFQC